jgi:hypothetical protein
LIKPIEILKKPTGSIWFYKPETKKQTKPKPKNRAKTKKFEPNRFEPVFI